MKKTLLIVGSFLFYNGCDPESTLLTANVPDGTAGLEDVVSNNARNTGDTNTAVPNSDTKKQTDASYTPPLSVDTIIYRNSDTTNYETSSNNDTNTSNSDINSIKITTVEDCVSYLVEQLTEDGFKAETNDDNWQINLCGPSVDDGNCDYIMVEAQIRVKIPEDKIGKISCDSELYISCKISEPEYNGFSSKCKPYVEILLPKSEAMINYALSKSLEQWLK